MPADVINRRSRSSPPSWRALRKSNAQFEVVDLFQSPSVGLPSEVNEGSASLFTLQLLFLILLGVCCCILFLIVDTVANWGYALKTYLVYISDEGVQLLLWVAISVVAAIFAFVPVYTISSTAAGSGIPEMKCILSGVVVDEVLEAKTMVAKLLGVVCGDMAGLSIGREGPFVHISSCIAAQLLKLPFFRILERNDLLRLQLLGAACAAGVAATFGAPVGGVLFSIEVTATYYLVSNLWKGIAVSTVISLSTAMFRATTWFDTWFDFSKYKGEASKTKWISLFTTNFPPDVFGSSDLMSEILVFAALGIICGLVGVLFNQCVKFFYKTRKNYCPTHNLDRCMLLIIVVGGVGAVICWFVHPLLREQQYTTIGRLFQEKCTSAHDTCSNRLCLPSCWLSKDSIKSELLLYVVLKFFMTACAVSLPIPSGLFTPVFALGAGVGRLVGEVASEMFPELQIQPAGYAVVGAAALTAGVCRTLSIAVIVFELTSQLFHMLPALVSVVIATAVGSLLNRAVYDVILDIRGLPYLHDMHQDTVINMNKVEKVAQDVMFEDFDFIEKGRTSLSEIKGLLVSSGEAVLPIIEQDGILIGYVDRKTVYWALSQHEESPLAAVDTEHPSSESAVDIIDATELNTVRSRVGDEENSSLLPRGRFQLPYCSTPFCVAPKTSLNKVYHIFAMLGLGYMFVVERGKLKGVISKRELMVEKHRVM